MPTNHLGRLITIAAILFLGIWAIFPSLVVDPVGLLDRSVPFAKKHNLKPGIDMVGGTSLLYEVQLAEGSNPNDMEGLSTRVMDALKKRVDPEGIRNLVWRPQGNTRLEIQMPRAGNAADSDKVRTTFAGAQRDLEETNVRMGSVLDAVQRLTGEAREKRLSELAMDSATRKEVFAGMVTSWDEISAARQRRDRAAQAAAELTFDGLRARIEPTNVSVPDLETKLTVLEEARAKQVRDPKAPAPSTEVEAMVQKLRDAAAGFASRAAALDAYVSNFGPFFKVKSQLDDSADLKRLLQGSGVLEYHILVAPEDPRVPEMVARLETGAGTSQRSGDTSQWAQVDKPEDFRANGVIRSYSGRVWVLLDLLPERSLTANAEQKWSLKSAAPERDQQSGEQHVAFQMDAAGGLYMSRLTGANVGKPMAIVLDDKVISAPNINSQIGERGIITGKYTAAEIKYLVNTLNAGSLPARLADEPISERTVGPQLGADNLRDGFLACLFGLFAVAVFLIGYYYLTGLVAYISVVLNLLLILGALAALNATFTLPSVAALVLTLGSAVDANVLIFERLREEQQRGFPIKTALRNAYDRAFSAIVDSNVVTGITSLVLYLLGSEEVKGFGLTLLLGIVTSLFTSLYVTKTLFAILVDKFGVKNLGSFPQSVPAWDRFLKPNIDWMSKVWIFGLSSVALMTVGLVLFAAYVMKGRMFDVEFSSGTAVTIDLREPISQAQIRQMLVDAGGKPVLVAGGGGGGGATTGPVGGERNLTVAEALPAALPVSIGSDNLSYEIVTPNSDVPAVRAAVLEAFGANLKVDVPSTFAKLGVPAEQALDAVLFAVEGAAPAGRFAPEQWFEYKGGVAIYLDNISPPMTAEEIRRRVTNQRLQPVAGQGRTLPPVAVFTGTTAGTASSEAVILAVDAQILSNEDREKWWLEVASPMWRLVNDAVNRPPTLSKVNSFNPQVAGGTQQDALVALVLALIVIMGYVWIRFGNLKYGTATVAALLHDSLFVMAALGFAHLLSETILGDWLRLEAFRINLTLVAGILTVMGYSMADTIVVFDRIRELRGQYGGLSKKVINDAINQTLSRTLLTAGTTIATLSVMYVFGGPGLHGFTYVLLVGIMVGTYSSIAIAAPLLMVGMGKEQAAVKAGAGGGGGALQKA